MIEVRLEIKEIEYLKDLVSEAWFFKRPTSLLSEHQQEQLFLGLKRVMEESKGV